MRGFFPVLRKEAVQMIRDRGTLQFAMLVPAFQLVLFGLIDTNVRHVRTVVLDQSRTVESRILVTDFVNTSYFDVVAYATSRPSLREYIVAGRASVGIEIPPDYARRRLNGEPADVLVLIDGSDSTIATQALAAANGLALSRSVAELAERAGARDLPIRTHPLFLFNPDARTANLLIPGLVAILLTFSGTVLAAFAIVRERERGTLEQLYMTPVAPLGLMIGKIIPYAVVAFAELGMMLAFMRWAFGVEIRGSLLLLLLLAVPFILTMLGLGLLISTRAHSQQEAMQAAMGTMLPSIFLSGYIFPIDTMPAFFQWVSRALPATYLIEIMRGIILRGATLADLWPQGLILAIMSVALIAVSALRFHKKVG